MNPFVVANIILMLAMVLLLYKFQKQYMSFTRRVFIALGMGVGYGCLLQLFYGADSATVATSNSYFDIIGSGYVQLLRMIIVPLVMVSIISAIIKLNGKQSLGKISTLTIGMLLFTVMIAALISIGVSLAFGLNASGLAEGAQEIERGAQLVHRMGHLHNTSLPSMLLEIIPANPFLDMTGARSTSIISVVIFSAFIGTAALGLHKKKPELGQRFDSFMEVAHALVMRLVTIVLRLTPYGVLALMTKMVASSNIADIMNLLNFILASYVAILLMFGVHLILVALVGGNPWLFLKKCMPALTFAFTSRSSAGTIPLSVQTQTQRLGIPEGIANFAASFGSTIGQNGCAGIYPAMLAIMIAPSVGINPMDLDFIVTVVITIVIGSLGVAGVGGGATFAALIVLSALNLPVALAGLLITVEPLIDMARTALNVSGSITSGYVTSRLLGTNDPEVFNSPVQEHELDMDSA